MRMAQKRHHGHFVWMQGNKWRVISRLVLPPSPDCSNIKIYVCIHTYAEYSSRQGGVYTHTHTQRGVFQAKLPEVGSRRWIWTVYCNVNDHSKQKIPCEHAVACSLPREGSQGVTYPGEELQSHHHLCGVFPDGITGLWVLWGQGGSEADRNG